MDLGEKAFVGNGSVDSDLFVPKRGSTVTLLNAVPDQDGTVQLFLRDRSGNDHPQGAAVFESAGVANFIQFPGPITAAFSGCFLRYSNTNATAGVVEFSGTDGGAA